MLSPLAHVRVLCPPANPHAPALPPPGHLVQGASVAVLQLMAGDGTLLQIFADWLHVSVWQVHRARKDVDMRTTNKWLVLMVGHSQFRRQGAPV